MVTHRPIVVSQGKGSLNLKPFSKNKRKGVCVFKLERIRACSVSLTELGSGDPEED